MIKEILSKNKKIAELEKKIRRIRRLLGTDELTGVLNRHGFRKETNKILKEIVFSKRKIKKKKKSHKRKFYIKDFSLLFLDVDGLKKINDIYGHKSGDKLIKTIANIIGDNIRDTDFVGRWGGDEFVVALVGSSEKDSFKIAETIRKAAQNSAKSVGFGKTKTTLSIGVAGVNSVVKTSNGCATVNDMIDCADAAMYEAKIRRGKDNTVKYSEIS